MLEPLIVGCTAGADLSAKEGYAVKRSAGNVILATDGTISGGELIVGSVAQGGGNASGGRVSVVFEGPTFGRAGGVLTRGTHQFLTCNALGKFVAATAGDVVLAEWIDDGSDAAAADGDLIPICILKHRYVTGLATTNVRRAALSAGAEAANVITVTVNVVDGSGNAVNAATEVIAELFDANGLEAVVGGFRLAENGAGTEVSASAKPRLLFTTDASGDAQLTVTDVATGANTTIFLVAHVVCTGNNIIGQSTRLSLTFDNA